MRHPGIIAVLPALLLVHLSLYAQVSHTLVAERTITLSEITETPTTFRAEVGVSGQFTWWLPQGADHYVLPLSAGVVIDARRSDLMRWLRAGSPYTLTELPALGLNYGDQMLVVILPWPHYAGLIVNDRIGIRFSLPKDRHNAAPCTIVAMTRNGEPLQVASAFREWRLTATNTGIIPRPRTLKQKIADLDKVSRLPGAPHFYLWGPALFSRHDVPRKQWVAFANALLNAMPQEIGRKLVNSLSKHHRNTLEDLAKAESAMDYLASDVAGAIDSALTRRDLLNLAPEVPATQVIARNKEALSAAFPTFLNPPESWGDGPSISMLNSLHSAGIRRALLLLSDLHAKTLRPDVVAHAEKLGYLIGPYDSYHSIHSPAAKPTETWETAQFDAPGFETGRVIDADGSSHAGFKGRGYHFSPQAAWPYVQDRVNRLRSASPYSAWFVDCDATAESFEDYSPSHPATMLDDTRLRRQRLSWLESKHRTVVGSEGGSALFADVIHFGHGVHTPYIGHLDPAFRDKKSAYYLGGYWPPDSPDAFFKAVPLSPSVKTPYFDPTTRIPLYQAAFGDEIIATHYWSFDSLKFSDLKQTRELMELLYMVPPMYHINRKAWPIRREAILKHLAFWGPLHHQLAVAPLIRFTWLTGDRLVQRSTFQTPQGEVSITVNFGDTRQADCPPHSAMVSGFPSAPVRQYHAPK